VSGEAKGVLGGKRRRASDLKLLHGVGHHARRLLHGGGGGGARGGDLPAGQRTLRGHALPRGRQLQTHPAHTQQRLPSANNRMFAGRVFAVDTFLHCFEMRFYYSFEHTLDNIT